MKETGKRQRAGFLTVKCKCGSEQAVFSRASTPVKCLKCDTALATPGASKAEVLAKIISELG